MNTELTTVDWKDLRTDETRRVEAALSEKFEQVDVYRYNSAAIRVRVVDSQFKKLTREPRVDLVEPVLDTLDRDTQAEILNLVLLYPGETEESIHAHMRNLEFENPTPSML